MNTGALIKAIVAVIVAFVVIIVVAVPIIGTFTESSEGTEEQNEITNNMYGAMFKSGTTFEYTRDAGNFQTNTITIGGEEIPAFLLKTMSFGEYYITTSEDYLVYTVDDPNNPTSTITSLNLLYEDGRMTGTINVQGGETTDILDIDVYDPLTVASFLNFTSYRLDWVETKLIGWSDETDYFVNEDSPLYIASRALPLFKGTIDNMVQIRDGNTYTIDTESTDNESLKITNFSTVGVHTGYLYVPETYYTELPVEAQVSGSVAEILNILPLIFAVGAVVFAIGAFIYNRS